MAFDGNGTYNRTQSDYVFDTVIEETKINSELNDIATALSSCIVKDGQTNPSANLPMNSKKHTGVANASARTEYAAAGQVTDGALVYGGVAGGTADALTLTLTPAVTALVTGMQILFKASANANTGAATVAVNGLSTVALELNDAALAAGDIAANKWYLGVYDGTAVQIERLSGGSLANIVEDTTPQLGGDLDLNGNNIDFPTTANVSDCLDEDNMASDSATALATQQSIKAYVDGLLALAASQASQAEIEARTNVAKFVRPDLLIFAPNAVKCAGRADWASGAPTLDASASTNMTSISDTATGRTTLTFDTDFSGADEYAVTLGFEWDGATIKSFTIDNGSRAAGSCIVETYNTSPALVDPGDGDAFHWHITGDFA